MTVPPGLYQRSDGTVYRKDESGNWAYLSPLFGEWLDVWSQPDDGSLRPYPRLLPALSPGAPAPDQKISC